MWYKNKKSGLLWHVTDKELKQRLDKDSNYEIVKAPKAETKEKASSPKITDEADK